MVARRLVIDLLLLEGENIERTDRNQPGDANPDGCRRQHRLCTLGRIDRHLCRRRRPWPGARRRHRAASLPDPTGMQSALRARRRAYQRTLQINLPDLGAGARRIVGAQQTCSGTRRQCADDFAALSRRPRRRRRVVCVLR